MHLDIIRPCKAKSKNLIRVNIEVNISKYQPDRSLTLSLPNAQSVKNKDSIIHHQIVQNKTDILLVTEDFKVKLVSNDELRMFEFAKWYVQFMHTTITILGIYRPPAGFPVEFLTKFTNWITDVVV